ncbi:unnamed protein product [[Candida] boidinii]|uniref:Unnamed protein product n=1 Tax=Candida boidinii TaxID=5477 RepID=A0A9W6SX65_CANBO|nr:hypothetical protein B5S30_g4541 [[Candida] boidinii]OWB86650.1 hypothetical protein B5S33_g5358 [[Candida] boidinii]GME69068.1 unnamed protein product [[Candida] boidinii]
MENSDEIIRDASSNDLHIVPDLVRVANDRQRQHTSGTSSSIVSRTGSYVRIPTSSESLYKEPDGFDVTGNNSNEEPTIDLRGLTYVSAPDHLNCPICQSPFVNPYTTSCGHTFCMDCIFETLRSPIGKRCPLDRTILNVNLDEDENEHNTTTNNEDNNSDITDELNEPRNSQEAGLNEDLFPSPIIIANIVDDLHVFCINKDRGCDWIGSRWEIKIHAMNECPYTRFECGRNKSIRDENGVIIGKEVCKELTQRRFLKDDGDIEENNEEEIEKEETESEDDENQDKKSTNDNDNESTESGDDNDGPPCPHEPIECTKCSKTITKAAEEFHLENECTKNVKLCNGCNLEFPIKIFEKHENYCEKVYVKCPGNKYGCDWKGIREVLNTIHQNQCVFLKLSGYLNKQDDKIKQLTNENKHLQSQLSIMLDSIVQGRMTNLGYALQIEEIEQNRTNSDFFNSYSGNGSGNGRRRRGGATATGGIGSIGGRSGGNVLDSLIDEDYIHLVMEFGRLRTDVEKIRPMSQELDLTKQIVTGLGNDTGYLKDELNSQRLLMNSLRQQMQFMMVDRRRSRMSMYNLSSSSNMTSNSNNNSDNESQEISRLSTKL